ncbi:hypothetical protein [Sporomusa acidovorans]|uniref:Uncharacterized protein n=1 Tax=Sporomusa acidovorans (strain ATCC 49682 / DSM 3132 / Mol) TaxID=1123286 RepID=A0ABZ3J8E6_SPOA4|nr:hypothetical protein [Sporomusa acidovorans]OZC16047.1 hypothetical protein SPACI_44130 [Sporomusa acidovorans DSM 3132]SDD88502.1 hypothetical protein SAMN04488499_100584 [Sporomusa acidovorans]
MQCANCGREIDEDHCQQLITEDMQDQPVCSDQFTCYTKIVANLKSKHMPKVIKNAARYAARG